MNELSFCSASWTDSLQAGQVGEKKSRTGASGEPRMGQGWAISSLVAEKAHGLNSSSQAASRQRAFFTYVGMLALGPELEKQHQGEQGPGDHAVDAGQGQGHPAQQQTVAGHTQCGGVERELGLPYGQQPGQPQKTQRAEPPQGHPEQGHVVRQIAALGDTKRLGPAQRSGDAKSRAKKR